MTTDFTDLASHSKRFAHCGCVKRIEEEEEEDAEGKDDSQAADMSSSASLQRTS